MATLYDDVTSNNLLTAIGGVAPSAGDSVIVRNGSIRYDAGLSFANDLLLVHLRAGFTGDIQDSNLIFTANRTSTGQFINEFGGRLIRAASTSSSGVWHILKHAPSAGGAAFYQTATVDLAFVHAGSAIFADDTTVTDITVSGGVCELRASSNATTTARCAAGVLKLNRDVTTLDVSGTGRVEIDNTAVSPGTTNVRGGTIIYGRVGSSGGALNGYAGVLDFRGCTQAVTFASGSLYPGVTILKPRGVTIDVSALTDYGASIQVV